MECCIEWECVNVCVIYGVVYVVCVYWEWFYDEVFGIDVVYYVDIIIDFVIVDVFILWV